MAGVEVHVLRGNARIIYGSDRKQKMVRPVIVHVSKDGRATAQSTTGITLLLEFEEPGPDGIVHDLKLKPPLKQALREGKWVIMAPSVA